MTKKIQLPSDDDTGFWQEQIKDINKISAEKHFEKPPVILPEIRNTVNPAQVYSGNRLNDLKSGETANIDRNTAQKFKHGEMPIEKRLDLHGMTEDKAYDAVENFIKNAYRQNCRCVLIITGKGLHRDEDDFASVRGILKNRISQWLNTSLLRPMILSFCEALPKDGGSGAFYVLLRRQRN